MIELIKNNQWIFWIVAAIGTFITSYFSIKNWLIKRNATNRKIFNEMLKSTYRDLFEFSKSDEISQLQLVTEDFNPYEIYGFCYRVKDFQEKGNSFKGIVTNCKFSRMYKVANQINSYTSKSDFSLSTIIKPDDTYWEFYNECKEDFNKLKKEYKKLYCSIFDNL